MLNVRFVPNRQTCPRERGTFVAKEKMNRKCDYDQKRKLALKTEVLLRQNISKMEKNRDIQKRCGKGENFMSFTLARCSSNFVYAEVKTGMSPSRQGHVLPLRMRLGKELVTNK
jgi:hypothetical protein